MIHADNFLKWPNSELTFLVVIPLAIDYLQIRNYFDNYS